MADGTQIEWTDATWNPITGCSVLSPGCTNCYAMRLAGTRLQHHPSRAGLTTPSKAGPVWNGQVRLNEEWLDQPLRWKRPRRIFVCAHGDLFHENVPNGWIMRVLYIMAHAEQHTFQVLTKRSERMRRFFERWTDVDDEHDFGFKDARGPEAVRAAHKSGRGQLFADMLEAMGEPPAGCAYPSFDWSGGMARWPDVFSNIWLGISAEDQIRLDERLADLKATPAAVRWVSAEPLIGPTETDWSGIDWVVAGGESGAGARPMHPDWARSLRDQCAAAGVAFNFKQWGEWLPDDGPVGHDCWPSASWTGNAWKYDDLAAASSADDYLQRVGKRAAGRSLDGVIHDAFPDDQR